MFMIRYANGLTHQLVDSGIDEENEQYERLRRHPPEIVIYSSTTPDMSDLSETDAATLKARRLQEAEIQAEQYTRDLEAVCA
jgi:hypothetical protein